jgi:tetratricopeptide (TPR) repeat protein
MTVILTLPFTLWADDYDDIISKGLAQAKSDPVKGIEIIDTAIKMNPDNAQGYIAKGMINYHYTGDAGKAAENFRKGVDRIKEAGERASMIKLIDEQTSKVQSQEEHDLLNAAHESIEKGEPQKAIDAMGKAIPLNKKNWKLYYEIGYALIDLDRHADSIQYFEKGLEINPFSLALMTELTFAYSHFGKVDKVKGIIVERVKYFGDAPELRHELAFAYLTNKQSDESIKVLLENMEKFPHFLNSIFLLGDIYYNRKDYGKARVTFEKFLNLAQKDNDPRLENLIEDAKRKLDECVSQE